MLIRFFEEGVGEDELGKEFEVNGHLLLFVGSRFGEQERAFFCLFERLDVEMLLEIHFVSVHHFEGSLLGRPVKNELVEVLGRLVFSNKFLLYSLHLVADLFDVNTHVSLFCQRYCNIAMRVRDADVEMLVVGQIGRAIVMVENRHLPLQHFAEQHSHRDPLDGSRQGTELLLCLALHRFTVGQHSKECRQVFGDVPNGNAPLGRLFVEVEQGGWNGL